MPGESSDKKMEGLFRDFELKTSKAGLSEEELFDLLADQVAYLIEFRMEYLLSLLYRNDVEESKINYALSPLCNEPANIAIARLVMERQKQRMATKKAIEVKELDDLEEGLEY